MSHKITHRQFTFLALAVGTALLSACGGGGGGASPGSAEPPSAPAQYLVDSFVTNLATKGGTFSASRIDSAGNQTTLKVVYAPGAAGWLVRQETFITNGVSAPTTSTTVNYSHAGSAFSTLGWMDGKGNTASELVSSPLPTVAKPGDGANLFTAKLLIKDNGINTDDVGLTHGLSYDWSLTNPSATRADFCLSLAETADFIAQTKIDCFQIDATGVAAAFKYTLKVHAKSIDTTTVYQ